jgi:predicted O-methyltransferase YrrM
MKQFIRQATLYRGAAQTQPIRDYLMASKRDGWPYCPADEGDVLFGLAGSLTGQDALEVGFATGSTAAYILFGLTSGRLTSIDYDQNHYERAGETLVRDLGLADRHRLIERDSIRALPELHEAGARFGLVFLDGWKTFDRMWVDTFYCARMLTPGGFIVFDDAQMPAVRKCLSILTRYYGFTGVAQMGQAGGWRQRVWQILTTRSVHRPYMVLRKTVEIDQTNAGRQFDFWRPF